MNKVQVTIFGRKALVDADQVQLILKKDALVADVTSFTAFYKQDPINREYVAPLIEKTMGKIIRLNRRIRRNVQFL